MKQPTYEQLQQFIKNAPSEHLAANVSTAYCTLRDRREETNLRGADGDSLRAFMAGIQKSGIQT